MSFATLRPPELIGISFFDVRLTRLIHARSFVGSPGTCPSLKSGFAFSMPLPEQRLHKITVECIKRKQRVGPSAVTFAVMVVQAAVPLFCKHIAYASDLEKIKH